MNYKYSFDFLRIIQIDGSEIFYHVRQNKQLIIKNERDDFNDHFRELLAPNLDLLYLDSIGKLKVGNIDKEQFSFDLINVSFNYRMKIDKKGNMITYEKNKKIADSESPENIREYLYTNGFILNGKEYVRYKRSSGAARSGNCLFIRKSLFPFMEKWSNTGLNPNKYLNDAVSFEAYKALSLSSLIGIIKLKPENILVVKDYKAVLSKEKVARVYVENKKLCVDERECAIENKIWDGEGLLDESVFAESKIVVNGKEKSLAKNGMMLLRNRFFKSCVFNTKLQKWFKENNITNVKQLHGITFAKSIDDVKLVITESSLKYIKMMGGDYGKAISKWCNAVSDHDGYSVFGIVKTDKPQRFFYGDMVETTYQLLNTLHLKDKKTLNLLSQNIDYVRKIRNIKEKPEYLRLYLKGEIDPYDDFADKVHDLIDDSEDEIEDIAEETVYTYKKIICDTLLDINRDVLKTKTFRYFVYDETINSFAMKLYDGRLLINGTYATLFGNPYELLLDVINEFEDGKSKFLHKGEICSSFFENDVEITGSRAPHITMGNLLLAKNKRNDEIEKWFNLTREIVIVDAIENNIQYRLNGADYDSDTMLITNNKIIVDATKEQYEHFLVPYSDFQPINNDIDSATPLPSLLSSIDNKIANNKVGTIINYSQLLNSYYWDVCNTNKNNQNLNKIYLTIAKLAVLSGAEIDSAKRSFPFSTKDELTIIEKYLISLNLIASEANKEPRQPLFFFKLNNKKDCQIGKIDAYVGDNVDKRFQTTMDYIWKNIHEERLDDTRFRNPTTFSKLTKGSISKSKRGGKQYGFVKTIISKLEEIYSYTGNNYQRDKEHDFELEKRKFKKLINKNLQKIKKHLDDIEMVRLTIVKLDKLQRNGEKGKYSNLFLLLFYLIFRLKGLHAYEFFESLFVSNRPVYQLQKVPFITSAQYKLFDKYCYDIRISTVDRLLDAIFA